MGSKDTVKAAEAESNRSGGASPRGTQDALAARHLREHTPERPHPQMPVTDDAEEDD